MLAGYAKGSLVHTPLCSSTRIVEEGIPKLRFNAINLRRANTQVRPYSQ